MKSSLESTLVRAVRPLRRCAVALLFIGGAAWAARAPEGIDTANPAHLSHGRFKDIRVYVPAGAPKSFALFLSGDEGWTAAYDAMARRLLDQGAMVAGIDSASFQANLNADGSECVFPDGDLENLSHFVQAYYHASTYLAPLLVGAGSGGTLAYAALVQAPRNTFAAALSLGFCPSLGLQKPLCKGSGLEFVKDPKGHGVEFLPAKSLGNPWVVLQGSHERACPAAAAQDFVGKVQGAAMATLPQRATPPQWTPQYAAAYNTLATHNPTTRIAPPPASLSDLPVVEIPAQSPAGTDVSDLFAILMSGDGGWAGLDQDVAGALAARGIPVVGLDSLRYYWTPRSPGGLAADTDRMIRYYSSHFGRRRVLLIGYSQGADVLPFAVNRLPEDTRAKVGLVAVMGMSEHALFEFHLTSWVSDDNSGPATLPEMDRITGTPVLCIYGEDEHDSLCPKLDPKKYSLVKLKGGHHFDGDYAGLAREIISAVKR